MDREVGVSVNPNQLAGWVPIRLYWNESTPFVDWCWVGKKRFTDPFFDHTIDGCMRLPFSTLFRPQTPIAWLRGRHETAPGLEPRGFIFHMSRCGSTLVSQMLAALDVSVVISEASPVDTVLRAQFQDPALDDEQRAEWLRWIVSALGQPRSGGETQLFIKFDCWNALELPLIRRAYPRVPWVFLYRDPVEVLVSQLAKRGAHMMPGTIEPALFKMNLEEAFSMQPEEYCARVLALTCEAALTHHETCPGLMINYEQLPDVVWTDLAGLFGIEVSDRVMEAFKRVTRLDAKNPSIQFESDSQSKQRSATDAVRQAAQQWLAPLYERLEAVRLGDPAPNSR
ncbi:MAG TPA: sulfotransferase family protein [Blastocatellia bacterium]|nr:sulfotransferase family protein [Blastocatellia bacterium]